MSQWGCGFLAGFRKLRSVEALAEKALRPGWLDTEVEPFRWALGLCLPRAGNLTKVHCGHFFCCASCLFQSMNKISAEAFVKSVEVKMKFKLVIVPGRSCWLSVSKNVIAFRSLFGAE